MRTSFIVFALWAAIAGCSSNTAGTDGSADTGPHSDAIADRATDTSIADAPADVQSDVVMDATVDVPVMDVAMDTGGSDGPATDTIVSDLGVDAPSVDVIVIDSGRTDATDAIVPDVGPPDAGLPDVVNTDSGGGPCSSAGGCGTGLTCCEGTCMNLQNDPLNCGSCGNVCDPATPMCLAGTCVAQVCSPACTAGFTCCVVNGPGPTRPPTCYPGATCPVGCPACL